MKIYVHEDFCLETPPTIFKFTIVPNRKQPISSNWQMEEKTVPFNLLSLAYEQHEKGGGGKNCIFLSVYI